MRLPGGQATPAKATVWCLGCLFAAFGVARLVAGHTGIAGPVPNDFTVFMSWGRFANLHPAREIYDMAALHAFQVASGWPDSIYAPCPYPPPFVYLLAALSTIPPKTAWAAWMGGTLLAFVAALATQDRRPLAWLGALALPVVPICVVSGQNGFLSAALLVAGFAAAGRRPVAAGILLGILAYKPQLGVLLPVALAAAGMWRTFAAAAATVASGVLLVGLLAGWGIWADWLASLGSFAGNASSFGDFSYLMPTVASDLGRAGMPAGAAMAAQAVSAVVMAALTWACFRKGPGPSALAVLTAATLLATPYAYVYDMAATAPAVVAVLSAALADGGATVMAEIVVLAAFAAMPIALTAPGFPFPAGAACTAAFLVVAARRALGRRSVEGERPR